MPRFLAILATVIAITVMSTQATYANQKGDGACFSGQFGSTINCGGGYVIRLPSAIPAPSRSSSTSHSATLSETHPTPNAVVQKSSLGTDAGPPCVNFGDPWPVPIVGVAAWLPILTITPCQAPAAAPRPAPRPTRKRAAPAVNPGQLAIEFWRRIPLPVPHPSIPPNYAITGLPAYLVTDGTLAPAPYRRQTPLGPLFITARGSYLIDWGDDTTPTWSGPYRSEGLPYPHGNLVHTYDNVGTVTVTVREVWTATWRLGPATGHLTTLQTTATVPNFAVRQVQAVMTG
jgi:hypothetical protein